MISVISKMVRFITLLIFMVSLLGCGKSASPKDDIGSDKQRDEESGINYFKGRVLFAEPDIFTGATPEFTVGLFSTADREYQITYTRMFVPSTEDSSYKFLLVVPPEGPEDWLLSNEIEGEKLCDDCLGASFVPGIYVDYDMDYELDPDEPIDANYRGRLWFVNREMASGPYGLHLLAGWNLVFVDDGSFVTARDCCIEIIINSASGTP